MQNSKTKKLLASIILVATISSIGYLLLKKSDNNLAYNKIKPPIPELAPMYTIYAINASENNTITTPNGSKILIKAQTLCDSLGNTIDGEAEVYYREYLDVNEILLSGIHMEFEKEMMSSGGMFDIKAMQGKQKLFVKPDEQIEIQLLSKSDSIYYPVWQLDTNTNTWTAVNDSMFYTPNDELTALKQRQNEIKTAFKMPLDANYFCFNYLSIIDVHYGKYNHKASVDVLKKVRDYGFTFSNLNMGTNVNYYSQIFPAEMMLWKNLSKAKIPNNGGQYTTFLNQIDENNNIFNLTVLAYKDTFFNGKIQAVMPLTHLYRYTPQAWQSNYDSYLAEMDSVQNAIRNTPQYVKNIALSNFGIYNYDYLINNNQAKPYLANFILSNKEKPSEIFYLIKSKNVMAKYPQEHWKDFRILNEPDDLIVCILENRRVEVYYPNASDYARKDTTFTFKMQKSDIIINKKEDFDLLFKNENQLSASLK